MTLIFYFPVYQCRSEQQECDCTETHVLHLIINIHNFRKGNIHRPSLDKTASCKSKVKDAEYPVDGCIFLNTATK
jgi:hypothetical protein